MKTLLMLLMLSAPAAAGERWCNENLPYDIERIPHGFAVVRINKADYCRENVDWTTGEEGPGYICNDDKEYRLDFREDGPTLTLTYTHGQEAQFIKCRQ